LFEQDITDEMSARTLQRLIRTFFFFPWGHAAVHNGFYQEDRIFRVIIQYMRKRDCNITARLHQVRWNDLKNALKFAIYVDIGDCYRAAVVLCLVGTSYSCKANGRSSRRC